MAEIFPDSWRRPEALPWVVDLIKSLPLSPKDKKRTLEEWGEWAGATLTGRLIEQVTAVAREEVPVVEEDVIRVVREVPEPLEEEVPVVKEDVIRVVREPSEPLDEERLELGGGGIGGRRI